MPPTFNDDIRTHSAPPPQADSLDRVERRNASARAPAVFVSHGHLDAGLGDPFGQALRLFGARLGNPRGVVVLSAHWESMRPIRVTGARRPTLDLELPRSSRPAMPQTPNFPGSPTLAADIVQRLAAASIPAVLDMGHAVERAAWLPVALMFPQGRVPIVQVSIPAASTPPLLESMGRALGSLRHTGVVLLGSGGVVQNPQWEATGGAAGSPLAWARAFDEWVRGRLDELDVASLLEYRTKAPHAHLAAPTAEHLAPLFFVLGARATGDKIHNLYEGFASGSVSLRSFVLAGRRAMDVVLPEFLRLPA